eukprot:TRINITY_DN8951_c0_g1_i1.p1 TRINITY_DN8951_c0_g1~~TRINITY_DN8951_c0_g1_i1.p1  ORF type:complete len:429 (+),score=99.08 TRINITY_DN8951_c0_g1_i1:57-1343(+)
MNAGVIGIEVYFPRWYVEQQHLEKFMHVPAGKFTKGLGQERMSFVDETEDTYSMALTVVHNLLDKYQVDPKSIGRLECGSETHLDLSKSIKSHVMPIFEEAGNHDIEGVDSLHACYSATAALFNSVAWMYSPSWDGRLAIVVAVDIAEYEQGPALCTGGAGAVAMLIGPNASLVLDPVRASFMSHVYDFYKPDLSNPFPVVFGEYSNKCYMNALDQCYKRLKDKYKARNEKISLDNFEDALFHCPYSKLFEKARARLEFLDENKDLNQNSVLERTLPLTKINRNVGNTYTGSLYMCLASLVDSFGEELQGKRILLFSYGSGCAASMFSFSVASNSAGALGKMQNVLQIDKRLNQRIECSVGFFLECRDARKKFQKDALNLKPPAAARRKIAPLQTRAGNSLERTYVLTQVDQHGRRSYSRLQHIKCSL